MTLPSGFNLQSKSLSDASNSLQVDRSFQGLLFGVNILFGVDIYRGMGLEWFVADWKSNPICDFYQLKLTR